MIEQVCVLSGSFLSESSQEGRRVEEIESDGVREREFRRQVLELFVALDDVLSPWHERKERRISERSLNEDVQELALLEADRDVSLVLLLTGVDLWHLEWIGDHLVDFALRCTGGARLDSEERRKNEVDLHYEKADFGVRVELEEVRRLIWEAVIRVLLVLGNC